MWRQRDVGKGTGDQATNFECEISKPSRMTCSRYKIYSTNGRTKRMLILRERIKEYKFREYKRNTLLRMIKYWNQYRSEIFISCWKQVFINQLSG